MQDIALSSFPGKSWMSGLDEFSGNRYINFCNPNVYAAEDT